MKINLKQIAWVFGILSITIFVSSFHQKSLIIPNQTIYHSIIELNYASLLGDYNFIDAKNLFDYSKSETNPSSKDNLEYSVNTTVTTKKVPLTGNLQQLKYFFEALKTSKTKTLRIAHIGDSIIFGEMISDYLRQNFQEKFGGNGQGFISMNTDDWGARRITKNTYSSDWKEFSLFKRYPGNLPLGLNGSLYIPTNESWVKFETQNYSNFYKFFKVARLFYSNVKNNSEVIYSFNNGTSQSLKLKIGKNVNICEMNHLNNATSIKLNFSACEESYFYGVSLENGVGLYLDNFPIRGNTGVALGSLDMNILKNFNELQNYKLIILQFGANVISPEHNDYMWYAVQMEKVINHFKQAFPSTSIIIVSVGDKSVKKGSSFSTDPKVFLLLKAQKILAEKTNVAFWNCFEAMGGANSMIDWVNANPPLAHKDYGHLTSEGGKIIADLLTETILNEYYKYK